MSKLSKTAGQRRRIKRRKATIEQKTTVERLPTDKATLEVASNLATLALAVNTLGLAPTLAEEHGSQLYTLRCTLATMADQLDMTPDDFVWYATLGVTMVDAAQEIEPVGEDDGMPWDGNVTPKLESCLPFAAELLTGIADGSLILWYSFSRRYVSREGCRPAIKGAKCYSSQKALAKIDALLESETQWTYQPAEDESVDDCHRLRLSWGVEGDEISVQVAEDCYALNFWSEREEASYQLGTYAKTPDGLAKAKRAAEKYEHPEPELTVAEKLQHPLYLELAAAGYDAQKSVEDEGNLKAIGTVLRAHPQSIKRTLKATEVAELIGLAEEDGVGDLIGTDDDTARGFIETWLAAEWNGTNEEIEHPNPDALVFADIKELVNPREDEAEAPRRKIEDPFLNLLVTAARKALAEGTITAADLGL